jgi:hypothetical protein
MVSREHALDLVMLSGALVREYAFDDAAQSAQNRTETKK